MYAQTARRMGMAAAVLGAVLTQAATGLDNEYTRPSLRGLKGVAVIVEDIDDDARRNGLSKEQIQTSVELRLRRAGIQVLSKEERVKAQGMPCLYVRVTTRAFPALHVYAFSIDVQLVQSVLLVRDPALTMMKDVPLKAMTWGTGFVDMAPVADLAPYVRDNVADNVDKFVNAYYAENPTERK